MNYVWTVGHIGVFASDLSHDFRWFHIPLHKGVILVLDHLHSHGNSTSEWYAGIILGLLQHCAKMSHTHTHTHTHTHIQMPLTRNRHNLRNRIKFRERERAEAGRTEPSLVFPAAALLTRRPHTWSRCCHASFHLGPGQDHSLWCMGVSHFSQTGGIHCTPPAKIEKVI